MSNHHHNTSYSRKIEISFIIIYAYVHNKINMEVEPISNFNDFIDKSYQKFGHSADLFTGISLTIDSDNEPLYYDEFDEDEEWDDIIDDVSCWLISTCCKYGISSVNFTRAAQYNRITCIISCSLQSQGLNLGITYDNDIINATVIDAYDDPSGKQPYIRRFFIKKSLDSE